MDITSIVEILVPAITGGGLVALFTIPEKKSSKRLDNAERLLAKYEPLIQKLEKDIEEKDEQIKFLTKKVNMQDSTIAELRTKLNTMELIGKENKLLRCELLGCKKRVPSLNKEELESLAKV